MSMQFVSDILPNGMNAFKRMTSIVTIDAKGASIVKTVFDDLAKNDAWISGGEKFLTTGTRKLTQQFVAGQGGLAEAAQGVANIGEKYGLRSLMLPRGIHGSQVSTAAHATFVDPSVLKMPVGQVAKLEYYANTLLRNALGEEWRTLA